MKTYFFDELPSSIILNGKFDKSCELVMSQKTVEALNASKLKIRVHKQGDKSIISGLKILIKSKSGNFNICVGNNNAKVVLEENVSGIYDFRLWRNSSILIGKGTTSNGVKIKDRL